MFRKPTLQVLRPLMLGSLLWLTGAAHATDYTYQPPPDGDPVRQWSDSIQWMPEGVPGPEDTATIGGTQDTPMLDAGGATVGGLTLSGDTNWLLLGNLTVISGAVNWSGSGFVGTVNFQAGTTTTISGNVSMGNAGTDGAIINNAGTVNFNSGVIQGAVACVFNNSGTFTAESGTAFGYTSGLSTATFHNTGTFIKTGGDTTAIGDPWALNNSGVVNVQSGLLQLQNVDNQENVLSNGGHFTGPGRTRIITNCEINGTTTIDAGSVLELAAGATLDLNHSGTFAGPGTFEWSGGEIDGLDNTTALTIAAGSNFLISGSGLKTMGGTAIINNLGNTVWTGTGMIEDSASNFNNKGTFTAKNDSTFTHNAAGTFTNTGTFIKSNSMGITHFDEEANFINSGTVDVRSGLLSLEGVGNELHSGSRFVSGHTRIIGLPSNSAVSHNEAEVTISGTVNINANATLELGRRAVLHGRGTFNGPGTFNWSGGTLAQAPAITVASGTQFLISGLDPKVIGSDAVLNNSSTGVWTGTGSIENNGTINNLGTLLVQNDTRVSYNTSGTINNKGIFTKQGTSGSTTIENDFNNTGTVNINSGTLLFDQAHYYSYVQNGSTASTNLNGGNLTAMEASEPGSPLQEIDFNGGKLTGVGTIRGDVVNKGSLSVGRQNGTTSTPSILNITGDYTQGGTAALDMAIGGNAAGTQYDQLKITGAAMLGGTLNVSTISPFTPANNAVFTLLTYHTHTGTFTHVNGLTVGAGRFYQAAYNPTNLTLTYHAVPTITSLSPSSGPVATSVRITGLNLTGATAVQFNGLNATFTRVSDTAIQATVPAGATTGRVRVTTPAGAATSAGNFTVTPSHASLAVAPSSVKLSIASVQASIATVRLCFAGTLDADSASDPAHYTVQVNGVTVAIESTGYDASTHTVILSLPVGTISAGDSISVSWSDLNDSTGATLNGETGTLTAR
ncbi:MAG: hypothetical protein JO316_05525 [Abitibacteriaceae bacterium]|nr:hypothetical protein [Abditibacteriaceae bacterium]MBV9864787.1 hypothetical protein [Abditibacteriaceae bacterium]